MMDVNIYDIKYWNLLKSFIIIDGCTAIGKLDKYGTGQAMSYSRKYAFLNALNLKTGLDLEDGYNAKPFEQNSTEKSAEAVMNNSGSRTPMVNPFPPSASHPRRAPHRALR